jgi:hypothetical protein
MIILCFIKICDIEILLFDLNGSDNHSWTQFVEF